MTLADRLVVLDRGRIAQVGAPLDVYERPANVFTAGFIGSPRINLLDAVVAARCGSDAVIELPGGIRVARALPGSFGVGARLTVGLRPEHLRAHPSGAADVAVPIAVEAIEALGHSTFVYGQLAGAGEFRAKLDGHHRVVVPGELTLHAAADRLLLFDGEGVALPPAGDP